MFCINKTKIMVLLLLTINVYEQFCSDWRKPYRAFTISSSLQKPSISKGVNFFETWEEGNKKIGSTTNNDIMSKIKNIDNIIIGVPGKGYVSFNALEEYRKYLNIQFGHGSTVEKFTTFIAGSPPYCSTTVWSTETDRYEYHYNEERYNNKRPLQSDLGQKNCQDCFKETIIPQLNKLPNNSYDAILHGSSQGTATILNYLANLVKDNKYNEKKDRFKIGNKKITVKAIILEAPFATGTSVLNHRLRVIIKDWHYKMPYSLLLSKALPLLHNQMPSIVKKTGIVSYDPKGDNSLMSIQKIPKNIPIIMAHSQDDEITPFYGSKVLYYARTFSVGNTENTYLIPIKGNQHQQIFDNYRDERIYPLSKNSENPYTGTHFLVINNCPVINRLLYPNHEQSDTTIQCYKTNFQFDRTFGKKEYDELIKRENI